jgi:hypothetical protein
MNTTNITQYRIPFGDPLWHKFRTLGITEEEGATIGCKAYAGGVGSSEISPILGLMKDWEPCPQRIYHHKIGTMTPSNNANKNMIMGQIMEPFIGVIWKVFEGESLSWPIKVREYMDGDAKVRDYLSTRKSKKLNGYFVNERYPHLFSSFDYYAEKGTMGILNGPNGRPEIFKEGFPIECKRIKRMYANTWIDGIPPSFVTQLHQEMICSNSNYGEIAVLYDDNEFEIFPFYRNNETCAGIIHWGEIFWNKVLVGRENKKLMDKAYQLGQMERGDELMAMINSNEPAPDDGEAYLKFAKERYQPGYKEVLEGEIPMYYDSLEYKLAAAIGANLDDKQRGFKNNIMKLFTDTGAQEIDFGGMGKITYRPDKNGDRSLKVLTKPLMPLKNRAESEYNKIDFNLK